MVPPMSTTTASPALQHPAGRRRGAGWPRSARRRRSRSRPGRGPPRRSRRLMSAATCRSVRPARSQPGTRACTRSMASPAARSAATSAGLLRARSARRAMLARSWRRRAARRAAAAPSAPTSGPTARPGRVPGPSRPATSAYGSSVSSQAMISRPRPPAGDAWAAGSSSRGTTRNGRRRPGRPRHGQAGQPLELVRVVAGQVAQVRSGGEQQRVQARLRWPRPRPARAGPPGRGPVRPVGMPSCPPVLDTARPCLPCPASSHP